MNKPTDTPEDRQQLKQSLLVKALKSKGRGNAVESPEGGVPKGNGLFDSSNRFLDGLAEGDDSEGGNV